MPAPHDARSPGAVQAASGASKRVEVGDVDGWEDTPKTREAQDLDVEPPRIIKEHWPDPFGGWHQVGDAAEVVDAEMAARARLSSFPSSLRLEADRRREGCDLWRRLVEGASPPAQKSMIVDGAVHRFLDDYVTEVLIAELGLKGARKWQAP